MEKYDEAALRHFEDAKKLNSLGKLDNAGHLLGFAAECAIKYKITTLTKNFKSPHGHFPDIVNIARKHITQRNSMSELLKLNLMAGWEVNRRYFSTGNTTQKEINSWLSDAARLFASANLRRKK